MGRAAPADDAEKQLAEQLALAVGTRIRDACEKQRMTARELASLAHVSTGPLSKLMNGRLFEGSGLGRPAVIRIEGILDLPGLIAEFSRARDLYAGRIGVTELGGTFDTTFLADLRPPRAWPVNSLLLDIGIRRLRCAVVAPLRDGDDLYEAVEAALAEAGASLSIVDPPGSDGTLDPDRPLEELRVLRDAISNGLTGADLAVLLVTSEHGRRCRQLRSILEDALDRCVVENVPVLVYSAPDALARAYQERHDWDRHIVSRLYEYEPKASESSLTCLRVSEFPTVYRAVEDLRVALSQLLQGGLTSVRQFASVAWNDARLKAVEERAPETWILTPDFFFELDDPLWAEVCQSVVSAGRTYRFLFPESAAERATILHSRLTRSLTAEEAELRLQLYCLPDAEFPWWPQLSIYSPNDPATRRAFIYDIWDRALSMGTNHNYLLPAARAERLVRDFAALCTPDREFRPRRF